MGLEWDPSICASNNFPGGSAGAGGPGTKQNQQSTLWSPRAVRLSFLLFHLLMLGCVCVSAHVCACHGFAHGGQSTTSGGCFFKHVGLRESNSGCQSFRPWSMCHVTLSHLTGPGPQSPLPAISQSPGRSPPLGSLACSLALSLCLLLC